MASYVKLLRSIWMDDDFRALPAAPQRLYMLLLSQPDVSHCGVLPLTPGRWGHLASDTDADSVRFDLLHLTHPETLELTVPPFVLVDEGTEELLIRSYAKHDEGYKVPNIKKALVRSIEEVMSPRLRCAVIDLLGTLDVTVELTLRQSQQPAAAATPYNGSRSSNGRRKPSAGSLLDDLAADELGVAAAAFERWITWRLDQPDVKMRSRMERSLRDDAPNEWHHKLVTYFQGHAGTGIDEVLYDVFRINPSTMQRRAS